MNYTYTILDWNAPSFGLAVRYDPPDGLGLDPIILRIAATDAGTAPDLAAYFDQLAQTNAPLPEWEAALFALAPTPLLGQPVSVPIPDLVARPLALSEAALATQLATPVKATPVEIKVDAPANPSA